MELIKAVRVRPENALYYERLGGIGDYKINLFKEGKNKYKVSFFPVRGSEPTGIATTTEYKKSGVYENLTDDDFINAGLDTLSKINKKRYEIIQDPWQNEPPIKRIYGTDPYFLNNGAKVLIRWFIGDRFNDKNKWQEVKPSIQTGIADVWSNDNGQELDVIPYQSYSDIRSMQNGLFKTVEIYAPIDELPPFKYEGDDDSLLISSTNLYVKKHSNDSFNLTVDELTYSGKIYDTDILKSVIERWKIEVPNYDLELCDNQYQPCFSIEYKSPLTKQDLPDRRRDNTSTPYKRKEKITVILPTDLKLKVNQDLLSLKVYIGEVPVTSQMLDGFEFTEVEDDISLLGDEYIESNFEGAEESVNEITDEPIPDSEILEPSQSGYSNPIPSNTNLSTLIYKDSRNGKYYIKDSWNGLAGDRLKRVINDLQSYLNKNGYPGTILKNNGVMRDLEASTYPGNPKRAIASLHGAGLAIDLKFSIPGKVWNSISDNKNLASDTKLNKLIYAWVQSQGDLTWGGQWGKSKPGEGLVQGWGITEYHHFEIKASNISKYWEPYKDKIAEIGFDYKKLGIKVGKGSELERFNKVVLASVNVVA